MTHKVVISSVQNSLKGAVNTALSETGWDVPTGEIIIKPNVCMPEYYPGAVTRPSLIRNLVAILRDRAERVTVVESNGYNYPCNRALINTGIADVVNKAGGRIINLSHEKVVQITLKNSPVKRLFLPKILLDADALIDMPVMKTHEFTTYGGAIKNLFGCLPDNRRIFLHPYLDEVLFYLLVLLKPEMTIMDATVAMEGRGPTRGSPVDLNLILASENALAVDVVATKLMKLTWRSVKHLEYIAQKTNFDENGLEIIGPSISEISRSFVLPSTDLPMASQFRIFKYPWLTKILFCSPQTVKILQKMTLAYREITKHIG